MVIGKVTDKEGTWYPLDTKVWEVYVDEVHCVDLPKKVMIRRKTEGEAKE